MYIFFGQSKSNPAINGYSRTGKKPRGRDGPFEGLENFSIMAPRNTPIIPTKTTEEERLKKSKFFNANSLIFSFVHLY